MDLGTDTRFAFEFGTFDETETDDGVERLAVFFTPTGCTAVRTRISGIDTDAPTAVIDLALNSAAEDVAAIIVVTLAQRLRREMPRAEITVTAPGVVDGPDGPEVRRPTHRPYPATELTSEVGMGGGTSGGGGGSELGAPYDVVVKGLITERSSLFSDTDGGHTCVRTTLDRAKGALSPEITVSVGFSTADESIDVVWMIDAAMRASREFGVPTVRVQPRSAVQVDMLKNNGWTPVVPDGRVARMLASRSTPLMQHTFTPRPVSAEG